MSAVWLRLCVDRGLAFGQTVEVAHCRGCPTLPELALRLAAARKSDARNSISHRRPGPAPTARRPSVSRARRRPIASAWRTAKPTSACRAQATLRWSWRKSRPTNSIPIPRAPEARRARSAFPSRSARAAGSDQQPLFIRRALPNSTAPRAKSFGRSRRRRPPAAPSLRARRSGSISSEATLGDRGQTKKGTDEPISRDRPLLGTSLRIGTGPGRPAPGRFDPFAEPSTNERCLPAGVDVWEGRRASIRPPTCRGRRGRLILVHCAGGRAGKRSPRVDNSLWSAGLRLQMYSF